MPVVFTAVKNRPSKRAARLVAARSCGTRAALLGVPVRVEDQRQGILRVADAQSTGILRVIGRADRQQPSVVQGCSVPEHVAVLDVDVPFVSNLTAFCSKR